MRTLFSRIFVAFWLAMGLIVIATIAVAATVTWRRIALRETIDPAALTAEAEAALRNGGRPGLEAWLDGIDGAHPGVDVYVLGPDGDELLGRRMPDRLGRWLAREQNAVAAGATPAPRPVGQGLQFSASHLLASATISAAGSGAAAAADDATYTMAVAWFGSSVVDVLGSADIAILLLVFAVASSAGVAWVFAGHVAAPIKALQESTRRLAGGDLDARAHARACARVDEIGALARDFNHMADELKANIAARELLLRDVSHELRSPLARIRIALGLAERGTSTPAQHHQQLKRIERDVERMDVLIGEMMRLTRLSGAAPPTTTLRLDLALLVEAVVEDARLEAAADGKTVRCAAGSSLFVDGDAELLRRAIENVVRNAVRFAPAGGVIEIETAREGDAAVVRVRDGGPGVPDAELERIFEPFYRVAEARDRDSGGAGLGLAITARVMALHGGAARARNRPGGGLEVELRTPLSASDGADAPHADDERLEAAE
jgi:two-component system sensor histidine kinase CpxA